MGRLLPAKLLPSPAEHSFSRFVIDQSKALVAIRILRNVVDTLHVVIAESNQFNVLLDTDRVRALGQNDHSALNIPAQNNFSWRHITANFLGNLNDVSVLEDWRVRLTEWRVCRYYNTLLAAELNQLVFLVVWMSLDLVESRDDLCVLKQLRECLDTKVAYSNSLDLTLPGRVSKSFSIAFHVSMKLIVSSATNM